MGESHSFLRYGACGLNASYGVLHEGDEELRGDGINAVRDGRATAWSCHGALMVASQAC